MLPCHIVRDLLPSYLEHLTGPETEAIFASIWNPVRTAGQPGTHGGGPESGKSAAAEAEFFEAGSAGSSGWGPYCPWRQRCCAW